MSALYREIYQKLVKLVNSYNFEDPHEWRSKLLSSTATEIESIKVPNTFACPYVNTAGMNKTKACRDCLNFKS